MKFNVEHNYVPAKSMRFRLQSINRQFLCTTLPNPSMAESIDALREPNEAAIIFDDSREIDLLIHMLETFRNDCFIRMGEWERKGCR